MREVKFRAFTKKHGMIYSDDGHGFRFVSSPVGGNYIEYLDSGLAMEGLDGEEPDWMQYTGLKDKNGKEIYGGDIVKAYKGAWGNGEVMFRNCAFRVHAYILMELADDVEVIGNVHEAPELLKQKEPATA